MNPKTGKTNQEVLTESTKVAQDVASSRGGTFEQGVGYKPGNVPVSVMEQPPSEVQLPQQDISSVPETANSAVGVANAYLSQAQQQMEAPQQAVSQSESQLRELMGIAMSEPQAEADLRKQKGVSGQEQELNRYNTQIQQMIADIEAFDDNTFLGNEAMRAEAAGRDVTKRTFSAQSHSRALERAMERTGRAAELRAVTAAATLTQGNIELAEKQIAQAMETKFAPVKMALQNEMFFLQRHDATLSAARQEVVQARQLSINRQIFDIDYAQQEVQKITELGFVSPHEIEQIMKLDDPQEQIQMAREIHARGAGQQRQLEMAIRQQQLQSAQRAAAGSSQADKTLSIAELQEINAMGHDLPMGSTWGDAAAAGVVPGQGGGEPSDFATMVINNPSLINDLTPTERGNVYKEIAAAGGQFQTAAQKSALDISKAALTSVNDILPGGDDGALDKMKKQRQLQSGSGLRGITYYIPGSGGRQFSTKLDTLKAQLELPNLEFLAGLGRMSQEQFKTLKQASSNLEARNLSNAEMKRQLEIVRKNLTDYVNDSEKRGASSLPSTVTPDAYQEYLDTINQ